MKLAEGRSTPIIGHRPSERVYEIMSIERFRNKMEEAGLSEVAIRSFERSYQFLVTDQEKLVRESSLDPVEDLPHLKDLASSGGEALLDQTVMIKLNGGLGTGMGLDKVKSLLEVRDGLTFLDLIALQVTHLRQRFGSDLRFMLMNSFSTSDDTREFLNERYPDLNALELFQNRIPKVDGVTMRPVEFPANPELEWCPPGHGDLYPSLLGSGWLDRLLDQGVRYAFVSNSDNLGATLNLDLLGYFATSGKTLLMEVTNRTGADRKGGHLAISKETGRLLLRESAQCAEQDAEAFQDIERHRYFNTNNLWLRLDALKAALEEHDGVLPLPVIFNTKTVDPRNSESARVYQLETAMGSALECFEETAAVLVDRTRFAPVKTTEDLFSLRSDAFIMTEDHRLELDPACSSVPPTVKLDDRYYKKVDQFESLVGTIPSLKNCKQLTVVGPVRFESGVVLNGEVRIEQPSSEPGTLTSGEYSNETVILESQEEN